MVTNLQNEDLTAVGALLADHLAADTAINDYCIEHFNRAPTIIVGPPEMYLPGEDEGPYIFIHDFAKSEGATITQAVYQCIFAVGIVTDEEYATTDSGVIVLTGQQRTSELMTLVQDALYRYKNGCQPPNTVEQNMPSLPDANKSHWIGFIAAIWELPISIGGQNHF